MSSQLAPRLRELLVCPKCGGDEPLADPLICAACNSAFALQNGVPVFLPQPVEVALDHLSNPIGSEFEAILRQGKDFVLHLGAGATVTKYPNCIEFEHKIFCHTDVVGDAHELPFRQDVFDRVYAFNLFEHLRDPKTAADEILRVLKPGGVISIHTAFLQPLHEAPHHFYNATEYGVREWFSSFEIQSCSVSGNFAPGLMLGFVVSNVLDAARRGGATAEEQATISRTTLGQWSHFWAHPNELPPGFQTLHNLPQSEQKRVAAGFELIAHKPVAQC